MRFFNGRKNNMALSLQKRKIVRGIEIKRAPLGKYLEMIEILYRLPEQALGECFAEKTADEILAGIKNLDGDMVKAVFEGIFKKGPMVLVQAVACMTDVTEERLLYDDTIGIEGILEILEALIEVNSLGKLLPRGRRLIQRMKAV